MDVHEIIVGAAGPTALHQELAPTARELEEVGGAGDGTAGGGGHVAVPIGHVLAELMDGAQPVHELDPQALEGQVPAPLEQGPRLIADDVAGLDHPSRHQTVVLPSEGEPQGAVIQGLNGVEDELPVPAPARDLGHGIVPQGEAVAVVGGVLPVKPAVGGLVTAEVEAVLLHAEAGIGGEADYADLARHRQDGELGHGGDEVVHRQVFDGDPLAVVEQKGGHLAVDHDGGAVSVDGDILFVLEVHRGVAYPVGVLVALGAVGAENPREGKGILGADVVDGVPLQGHGGAVRDMLKELAELIHSDSGPPAWDRVVMIIAYFTRNVYIFFFKKSGRICI